MTMKVNHLFYRLFCIISIAMIGCEKSDSSTGKEVQPIITTRGDCDDCPDLDQCCCCVEIDPNDNNNSASIEFCGIDDAGNCTGSEGTCLSTSFNQGYDSDLLTSSNPRLEFCIELGTAFFVRNTHGSDNASVKVSCQRGEANPEIISFTLGPGVRNIQKVDTGCSLTDCN